jgi:hypothetical protein
MCHSALLLLSSIAFRILNSIMTCGWYKSVTELNEFERPNFWDSRNLNISISSRKIAAILLGNCLQQHLVYIERQVFSISFISRDYISLQAPCQIFAEPSARLGSLISHSIDIDDPIHWTYLRCHAALLLLIFITFCVLNSIMSSGRSKSVIACDEFRHSKLWKSKSVDVSISLKKIAVMLVENCLQGRVVYIRKEIFASCFRSRITYLYKRLSNFRRSVRADSTADFSFPCIQCSDSLDV